MGEARIPRKAKGRIAPGLLMIALLAIPFDAGDLELTKKAGDYTVEISFDRDVPTVGANVATIRVKDREGASVKEAKIILNYYMPPMARMAPMNYKVEAKWKKDSYRASMKLIMAGPWILILRITIGDKTLSAKFQIDAR
jgi:hypothetical protein